MSETDHPPGGPSAESDLSVTQEIKAKLDEMLTYGREQLAATSEMRAALAEIRKRINTAGPLILPRPPSQLPRAQKRRRPTP